MYKKFLEHFAIYACHPCAQAMLIFSVSFQFYRMSPQWIVLSIRFINSSAAFKVNDVGLEPRGIVSHALLFHFFTISRGGRTVDVA